MLQKARRKQKIKISRAVEDLRIPKKYLYAFENNDLTAFPSAVYAVGFLKNYADYLGLDAAPLVDDLKAHFGPEPLDDSLMRSLDIPTRRPWLPIAGLIFLAGLVLAGAYFGWSYFKGADYEVSASDELPPHLAAILAEAETQAAAMRAEDARPASILANDVNAYFNDLANDARASVRVLATTDVKVVIRDRLGRILQEGILYSGDSIELPRGEGLNVQTADPSALGFYVDDLRAVAVRADTPQNTGFFLVSLDNLQPSLDKAAPAS